MKLKQIKIFLLIPMKSSHCSFSSSGCMAERLKEKLLETDKMVDLVAGPGNPPHLPPSIPPSLPPHLPPSFHPSIVLPSTALLSAPASFFSFPPPLHFSSHSYNHHFQTHIGTSHECSQPLTRDKLQASVELNVKLTDIGVN